MLEESSSPVPGPKLEAPAIKVNRSRDGQQSGIEVSDLTFAYLSEPVLKGVDFSLGKGAIGLLGPNGSGKTTLLRCLLGQVPLSRGRVRVLGWDMATQARSARAGLGWMPERGGVIPGMSGVGLVAYMGELSGLPPRDAMQRAHEVLHYVGLADERYRQITLRQALSHTSGMPDMDESEYDALVSQPEADEGAAERYVRGLARRKLIAAPGQRFSYSNIAYNVLGDLIAKVSGQSFEDYMKEHVLGPAGMPASTFFYPEVDQSRLAVPHLRAPGLRVNPLYPYHRADAPASFLHSSLTEMCHWGSASLARGTYAGRRFLSAAAYEQMWTPVAPRGYPPFYEDGGLGWTLGHYAGVKTVSHGGMGFGWADFFILLPEIQRGAVLLCNAESSARDRLVEEVVRVMLEREPRVGAVSWVVPLSQALQEGGIQAAEACYAQIRARQDEAVYLDPEDLLGLAYQLAAVREIDLAIAVLGLNLRAFPEQVDSRVYLARLWIHKGQRARAEECLRVALALQPGSVSVADLLATLTEGS